MAKASGVTRVGSSFRIGSHCCGNLHVKGIIVLYNLTRTNINNTPITYLAEAIVGYTRFIDQL